MTSFVVAPECTELGLRAGAMVFRDVRVTAAAPGLRTEIAQEVAAIRARFSAAAIRSCPQVSRCRQIHQLVGVKARKEQPSVERLLGLALKRGDLPLINNLVDAYNLVSIRSLCSLGAHDLDKIATPVHLRLLTGQESFIPLGSSSETGIRGGEYGYVDALDRLLCRLDVVQAEFSKVTAQSANVLLIIEGTMAHSREAMRQAFTDVTAVVTRYCGGTAEVVAFPD
jgi:DNA/RNA-binding domain of Phe-tRNA-synthetase-like protein